MGTLIFDFNQEGYWLMLVIMAAFTLFGLFSLAIWIRFMVMLFRGQLGMFPVINRILYLTVPLIVGAVIVFFCGKNTWKIGGFYADWIHGNYSQISGPLENVTITEGGYRDETLMDVTFTVSDMDISSAYGPEQMAYFRDGTEVTIQYGWVGEELMIYRIYAVE